jgi:hypothetical protein
MTGCHRARSAWWAVPYPRLDVLMRLPFLVVVMLPALSPWPGLRR